MTKNLSFDPKLEICAGRKIHMLKPRKYKAIQVDRNKFKFEKVEQKTQRSNGWILGGKDACQV